MKKDYIKTAFKRRMIINLRKPCIKTKVLKIKTRADKNFLYITKKNKEKKTETANTIKFKHLEKKSEAIPIKYKNYSENRFSKKDCKKTRIKTKAGPNKKKCNSNLKMNETPDNTSMESVKALYNFVNEINNFVTVKNTVAYKRNIGIKTKSKKTIETSKKAIETGKKVIEAVVKTIKSTMEIKAVGISLIVILIFILILSIIQSSVTALYPAVSAPLVKDEETILNYINLINELDRKANDTLNSLLDESTYDDIVFLTEDDNVSVFTNVQDLLAILSVLCNQDIEDRENEIKQIHELSYEITNKAELYTDIEEQKETIPIYDDNGNKVGEKEIITEIEVTKTRSTVRLKVYSFDEIADKLNFDEKQKKWAYIIASSNIQTYYPGIHIATDIKKLTQKQIDEILKNAPKTDGTRGDILNTAYLLLGRVKYSWGGKGLKNDLNNLPTALDCSGFVGWVYKYSGVTDILFGTGTAFQWSKSFSIDENDLKYGDLGFLKPPNQSSDSSPNHVGIFIGKDTNGNNKFIHCAGGQGVVIDNFKFKYFRRVAINFND